MEAKTINLPDIISRKKEDLLKQKAYKPLKEIKRSIKRVKIRNNFKFALQKDDDVSIMGEYKPASPSQGHISDLKVEDVLPIFEKGKASAASILTEESFFKSNIQNLKMACKMSRLPLLRKDFILDEYQIYESRAYGASAILLMADLYPNLSDGILLAKYLGMDTLVECKSGEEINMALDAGAEIIGINNRNFHDFSIDLTRTKKLANKIPPEVILVSESGAKNAADVKLLSSYGADAILIGTGIMESETPLKKVIELVGAAKNSKSGRTIKTKICGITRKKDILVCQEQGVDLMGFINIKRSARFVSLNKISDLVSKMKNKNNAVLVMETDNIYDVQNALKETGINIIQFHSLTSDEIRKIKKINPELIIIKAVGISKNINNQKVNEIKDYTDVCDFILFDSEIKGKSGGTGQQIPLKLAIQGAKIARNHNKKIKLILAGGINSKRMKSTRILNQYFDYVDINSGVEDRPGIKNESKIREFMQVMR